MCVCASIWPRIQRSLLFNYNSTDAHYLFIYNNLLDGWTRSLLSLLYVEPASINLAWLLLPSYPVPTHLVFIRLSDAGLLIIAGECRLNSMIQLRDNEPRNSAIKCNPSICPSTERRTIEHNWPRVQTVYWGDGAVLGLSLSTYRGGSDWPNDKCQVHM